MSITALTDYLFNQLIGIIVSMTVENLEDWKVDEEEWEDEVYPLWEDWSQKYALNLDPNLKNKKTAEEKTAARKELEPVMHTWIEALRGNKHISDDQKREMSIYEEHHSTRPTPTTSKFPQIFVKLDVIRRIGGYFHIAGELTKTKPDGVNAIEMTWAKRDTPPETVEDLLHENISLHTKNTFHLDFSEADRGKAVYMAARYVMRASDSGYGPWGEIIFAIIP